MTTAVAAALSAVPIGIAFGFILERAGLGDSRVIARQLEVRDFTVVRVMFGAIVTAMLGILWGGALGLIDVGALAIPPTDLAAQALGGVIFGGGFALAALCPGTACVAAASGRRDGIAAVLGVLGGTLLTPLVWPAVSPAAASIPREGARLPEDLHLPLWLVASVIVAMAVLASMIARKVERRSATGKWWKPARTEMAALGLALALGPIGMRPAAPSSTLSAIAAQIATEQDHVDPVELAEWIKDRRDGLRVIDVREGVDSSTYVIPGAESVPVAQIATLKVAAGDHLVLYSDGGAHAAQAWVLLRARGVSDVLVLKDGMAAWEDEVLSPLSPAIASDTAQARFSRARALSLWFGGHPRIQPAGATPAARATPAPTQPAPAAARRRRKTC